MPKDTPAVSDPVDQSVRLEPMVEDLTNELPTETVLPTKTVLPIDLRVDIDADLNAEIDDLFN